MELRDDLAFSPWYQWPSHSRLQVPANSGVYVFRLDREICRLLGKSQLLYVGKATTLASRLKEHRTARTDGAGVGLALRRIENQRLGSVQFAWRPCGSIKEAADLEASLLAEYKDEHLELPPLNNNEPNKRAGQAMRNLREALGDLWQKPVSYKTTQEFVAVAEKMLKK